MMDPFENNILYASFMTKFRREFEMACKLSYVIAIPHSDLLDNIPCMDQGIANSHLLMPSKLLKMHYTPLQVGFCDDIELDGKKLILTTCKGTKSSAKIKVNILAEQIGYNAYNKEFRIILIDKLLYNYQANQRVSFFRRASPVVPPRLRTKPPKPLTNHDDCACYLEFLSVAVTNQLERDIKRLQTNYMMLSRYLDDARWRIKSLVSSYVHNYEGALLLDHGINIICDSTRQTIQQAIENYAVHLLHGKLMGSIHGLYQAEDEAMVRQCSHICQQKVTPCQLGAQSAFTEFKLSDEISREIRRLPYLQSPLAMVSSIMRLIDMLSESLNQSVQLKALATCYADSSSADTLFDYKQHQQVSICSDDLIGTLVYSLAHAKPNHMYSVSKYLEFFGMSSTKRDQVAYYTTTLQVVIHYILNCNLSSLASDDESSSSANSSLVSL